MAGWLMDGGWWLVAGGVGRSVGGDGGAAEKSRVGVGGLRRARARVHREIQKRRDGGGDAMGDGAVDDAISTTTYVWWRVGLAWEGDCVGSTYEYALSLLWNTVDYDAADETVV